MRLDPTIPGAVALLAATPGMAAAQGVFEINPGLSVWATVVFLALLAILWRFAWGPILGAVQAREDRIQTALDESREQREEAQALLEEHKRQLADARRQASEIIAEGKAAGDRVRKEMEEKARTDAQGIIDSARREIEREKDRALAELRKESVEIALAAASRLMQERLDAEKDRELVESYLGGLGSDEPEARA